MPIKYEHGTPSMYASAAQMMGEAERIKTEKSTDFQEGFDFGAEWLSRYINEILVNLLKFKDNVTNE